MAQRIKLEARRELAIAIVGAGRLGASLALALAGLGYRVAAVASRDPEAATRLAGRIDGAETRPLAGVPAASDLLFLTAPDREIAALARSIEWRTGQGAVHCSGALGLDVLAPAREAGALAGCFHPIQSFPDRDRDDNSTALADPHPRWSCESSGGRGDESPLRPTRLETPA